MKEVTKSAAELSAGDVEPVGSTRSGKGKSPVKKSDAGKTRLTKLQWEDLLGMLMSGHYTQTQLSKIYGVSVQSIIKQRKKHNIKIAEVSSPDKTIDEAKKTADAMNAAANLSLEQSGKLIAEVKLKTYSRIDTIGKMVDAKLREAWGNKNLSGLKDDLKVLAMAQDIYERDLRLKAICLGFKEGEFGVDESSLTVLTVEQMSEEDVSEVQRRLDDSNEWSLIEHKPEGDDDDDDTHEEGGED